MEYLQNAWIRQGLDSKVLTEFGRPLECVAQAAVILAYFAFIVKVKGGWKAFYERSGLRLIKGKALFVHKSSSKRKKSRLIIATAKYLCQGEEPLDHVQSSDVYAHSVWYTYAVVHPSHSTEKM